jgi:CheY-like chemotaxis protein
LRSCSASAPVAGGREAILVVEDDALVRNFVIAQLQTLGYRTVAAADSRAALTHIDNGEPFDLLFTDVILPGGMNGRELADEVTKRRPGLKVLYTSGYTDNSIVHHGRLDEGVRLLTKPYRKNQLAQMVREALQGAVS